MERNLTSGSVFKNIVYFSLPYLLSYFLQTLYGMADLFIIGQFEGVASTTAVSIGSQVISVLSDTDLDLKPWITGRLLLPLLMFPAVLVLLSPGPVLPGCW